MLGKVVIRLFINAVALWAAAEVVRGIELTGEFWGVLLVALLFGLVNALIRPVMLLLSLPLLILTLGLLTIVINALMLMLTAALTGNLNIAGFWPALWGSILISLVSFVLSAVIRESGPPRR